MNPEKVFLVNKFGGEYEDRYDYVVAIFYDEEKAKEYIVERREKLAKKIEDIEAVKAFETEYINTHPYLKYEGPETKNWPRWPAGTRECDITVEMREERDRIKRENEAIGEEKTRLRKIWSDAFDVAQREFINSLGIPEKDHDQYNGYCTSWIYDPPDFNIKPFKVI